MNRVTRRASRCDARDIPHLLCYASDQGDLTRHDSVQGRLYAGWTAFSALLDTVHAVSRVPVTPQVHDTLDATLLGVACHCGCGDGGRDRKNARTLSG